ncbi:hypothetical protein K9U40_03190 [Xanthobacter autotrophicus]|uniref:hypothetical protein n=1 Tax=Xanthobacter TaxID=279 RepID=UPI0024ABCED1|nr:hypothetical protein [Xanthobacter autotrophicus]MDI4663348.1 hypothetical protein [Xanthobacter autotrophicus]
MLAAARGMEGVGAMNKLLWAPLFGVLAMAAAGRDQALAQGTKTIDQMRQECLAENPPARQADRSTLISRCIERKKEEASKKKS